MHSKLRLEGLGLRLGLDLGSARQGKSPGTPGPVSSSRHEGQRIPKD